MLIRTEAPADILVVDQLLKNVFATEAEADLVMALRENGQRTLSLVACDDEGEIVGHVMFSPVTLEGEDLNWQGLAPLAVKEEYPSPRHWCRVSQRRVKLAWGAWLSCLCGAWRSGLLLTFWL